MPQARTLTSDEISGLRDELTSGGTPTVWFTATAVGVPEGRSGKVVALDDPAEGDFIQIRPAGSKDVLSFSAAEVTVVKPPRKRKETQPVAAARTPEPPRAAVTAPEPQPATPQPAAKTREPQPATKPAPAADDTSKSAPAANRRKPKPPAGATVILTADQAGQWNVEVSTGKKRVLRPTPVSTSAVAQAAKSLHEEVAAAVEPLLEAAREQQRERVEQLERQLAEAQRMLHELTE
ncbi:MULTISPECIES: DUF6319 family protein [unclassified Saccharopolyspora]|uniref:DUF6319 family protein n=1 Tax=unclassified Saccharopolyspora TaxID=2646250 RepID=UPI001CD5FC2C|nr:MULTISPECIES: DUF6319 family protein [unclassified Saccharopolyspora]MCA1187644.1 DUF6319 family protein [Saccharopolyspora sp. 6T]MCA1226966.1 DUF6319 family protein [Saccharopolyspora sp. 6M]MCA1278859.1 DUF6319 family protein [Saccharopolyspora sp. 7B]